MTSPAAGPELVRRLREVPFGILVIAALLVVGAASSLVGGLFLMVQSGSLSWWAISISAITAPAVVYLAYHLVALTPWTWPALVTLVCLLFASSIIRVVLSSGLATAGLAEMAVELMLAAYLFRPYVRSRFGWTRM